MKKVELHCHLDGSISEKLYKDLAKREGVDIPCDIASYLEAPKDCKSLKEYLDRFMRVSFCMQKKEYLELVTRDVLIASEKEGVIYTEIRFAPAFSLMEGLTMEDATRSVLRAMKEHEEGGGIKSRAILCMMRGQNYESNKEVINTFLKIRESKDEESAYLGGIDLAGDEKAYPLELYKDLFDNARENNIPFTIHSGECGSVENILLAVKLGAKRIGHGIAAEKSKECRKILRDEKVVIEMCPTSNYQTKALAVGEEYPLYKFLDAGLLPMINTDNRTVSGTDLTREYSFVKEMFSETNEETFLKMNLAAVDGAFISEDEKETLKKKLKEN